MKATIVIPTYWRGPASEAPSCTLESDFKFDHATPLDAEGTLSRALASLAVLESPVEFSVAVVAASTRREIKQAVELKVQAIIAQYDYQFPLLMIGPDELVLWRRRLAVQGLPQYDEFLSLDDYANIRNMCLLAAVLTGADVAILFDDDQVYEDPQYLVKALEFIGKEHEGRPVTGVAGYYRQPDGSILVPEAQTGWERLWGNREALNQALGLIESGPRLQRTPFVFGGNMVLHRSLFERVPFDPRIPRGEDIDYLINAKFFGHDFLLDNQLWIKHLPPAKCAPAWFQMRQDIVRFSRERAKLDSQGSRAGLRPVPLAELDPYPGRFLGDNLHDLVMEASMEMAAEYLQAGLDSDAKECMINIAISKAEKEFTNDPFGEYLAYQEKWQEFIALLPELHIWTPPGAGE